MDVERYGQDNPKRVEAARYEEHLVEAERLLTRPFPTPSSTTLKMEHSLVLEEAQVHATLALAAATALAALCA